MFDKRRENFKTNNNLKKIDKDVAEMVRSEEDFGVDDRLATPVIHPVTFIDKDTVSETPEQLHSFPINEFTSVNKYLVENANYLHLNLTESDLALLDTNNRKIIIEQTANFIKQTAVQSVISSINFGDANRSGYLDLIPIKEYITDAIYNNISIRDLLVSYILHSGADHSPTLALEDEGKLRIINFAGHVAVQICNAINTTICSAAQKAINDVVLGVYNTNNVRSLYDKLISTNKTMYLVNKEMPDNFPNMASIFINSLIVDDIERALKLTIHPTVQNLLISGLAGSLYYQYTECLIDKVHENENKN